MRARDSAVAHVMNLNLPEESKMDEEVGETKSASQIANLSNIIDLTSEFGSREGRLWSFKKVFDNTRCQRFTLKEFIFARSKEEGEELRQITKCKYFHLNGNTSYILGARDL